MLGITLYLCGISPITGLSVGQIEARFMIYLISTVSMGRQNSMDARTNNLEKEAGSTKVNVYFIRGSTMLCKVIAQRTASASCSCGFVQTTMSLGVRDKRSKENTCVSYTFINTLMKSSDKRYPNLDKVKQGLFLTNAS